MTQDVMKYRFTGPKEKAPAYQTQGSTGFDLIYNGEEELIILPGKLVMIPTGFFLEELLDGFYLDVRPRSSMLTKKGLIFMGSGVIDSDYVYPSEVFAPYYNPQMKNVIIQPFERIAQGVITYITRPDSIPILEVDRTGGFGSTGE